MAGDGTHVIVIAGPNGAGKTTAAPVFLKEYLGVTEYVNADLIAQGLSAFGSEAVAFEAGRIMLRRLKELGRRGGNFAFETTLATRSYVSWLKELQERGYTVHLVFLWLPTPDMAVARVADRVRMGGHNVPESTIHRRYQRGLENFFRLYRPLVDQWWMYDNSLPEGMICIAQGAMGVADEVLNEGVWKHLSKDYL